MAAQSPDHKPEEQTDQGPAAGPHGSPREKKTKTISNLKFSATCQVLSSMQ